MNKTPIYLSNGGSWPTIAGETHTYDGLEINTLVLYFLIGREDLTKYGDWIKHYVTSDMMGVSIKESPGIKLVGPNGHTTEISCVYQVTKDYALAILKRIYKVKPKGCKPVLKALLEDLGNPGAEANDLYLGPECQTYFADERYAILSNVVELPLDDVPPSDPSIRDQCEKAVGADASEDLAKATIKVVDELVGPPAPGLLDRIAQLQTIDISVITIADSRELEELLETKARITAPQEEEVIRQGLPEPHEVIPVGQQEQLVRLKARAESAVVFGGKLQEPGVLTEDERIARDKAMLDLDPERKIAHYNTMIYDYHTEFSMGWAALFLSMAIRARDPRAKRIGRNKLMERLRKDKVLCSGAGENDPDRNRPADGYVDKGLIRGKLWCGREDGDLKTLTPVFTWAGMIWLCENYGGISSEGEQAPEPPEHETL